MSSPSQIDYEALAKKFGGTTTPAQPDYEALAKQFGGVSDASAAEPVKSQWQMAKDSLWNTGASTVKTLTDVVRHPINTAQGIATMPYSVLQGHAREAQHAYDDYKAGKVGWGTFHAALSVIPVVGPMVDDAIQASKEGKGPEWSGQQIANIILGKGLELGVTEAPNVKNYIDTRKTNAASFAKSEQVANIVKAATEKSSLPTGMDRTQFVDHVKVAAPYMDEAKQAKIPTVDPLDPSKTNHVSPSLPGSQGARNAAQYGIRAIDESVSGALDPLGADPLPSAKPYQSAMDAIKSSELSAEQKVAEAKKADRYLASQGIYPNTTLTVSEADALRAKMNAAMDSTLADTKSSIASVRKTKPQFVAQEAIANHLRDQLYDYGESQGVEGIREARTVQGSLMNVRNVFEGLMNSDSDVIGKASGARRQLAAGVTAGVGLAAGEALGGVAGIPMHMGGVGGAILGPNVLPMITERIAPEITRASALDSAFKKPVYDLKTTPRYPVGMASAPNRMTPQNPIRGSLNAPTTPEGGPPNAYGSVIDVPVGDVVEGYPTAANPARAMLPEVAQTSGQRVITTPPPGYASVSVPAEPPPQGARAAVNRTMEQPKESFSSVAKSPFTAERVAQLKPAGMIYMEAAEKGAKDNGIQVLLRDGNKVVFDTKANADAFRKILKGNE